MLAECFDFLKVAAIKFYVIDIKLIYSHLA